MLVNPKHPVSRTARKVSGIVAICGLSALALFTFFGPQATKVLEMPSGIISPGNVAKNSSCVDGVQYLTELGTPSAALLDRGGLARLCESKQSAGIEQFGNRYRTNCINGIQYIQIYERFSRGMFVRYDPATRLPMACESKPEAL